MIDLYDLIHPFSAYLYRKIVTRIANYCVYGSIRDQVIKELAATPYSIAVGESTDAFGSSYLVVCGKYLPQSPDAAINAPKIRFIAIIEFDEGNSSETIYNKLKEKFFSRNPKLLTNLMSIMTDQASNMAGINNGLGVLIMKNLPNLIRYHDLYYIYNLLKKKKNKELYMKFKILMFCKESCLSMRLCQRMYFHITILLDGA